MPMLQSAPMTGYKTGAATRRAILLALLKVEPQTVNGLAVSIGMKQQTVAGHVTRMARGGLLRVERGTGRRGSSVYLTDAGRIAARTV